MAFHRRDGDDATLNAGLVALGFFWGSGPVWLENLLDPRTETTFNFEMLQILLFYIPQQMTRAQIRLRGCTG